MWSNECDVEERVTRSSTLSQELSNLERTMTALRKELAGLAILTLVWPRQPSRVQLGKRS